MIEIADPSSRMTSEYRFSFCQIQTLLQSTSLHISTIHLYFLCLNKLGNPSITSAITSSFSMCPLLLLATHLCSLPIPMQQCHDPPRGLNAIYLCIQHFLLSTWEALQPPQRRLTEVLFQKDPTVWFLAVAQDGLLLTEMRQPADLTCLSLV